MERFSQFRDRGWFSSPGERSLLISTRLRDSTLPPNTYGTCGLSSALSHLSLHDPGPLALDRHSSLLSRSTMATYRCTGKEGGVVVDTGSPGNMVD